MPEAIKTWSEWLNNTRFSSASETDKQQMVALLTEIKDKVLDRAGLKPDDIILDIGTGTGLLAFGAYERLKNLNSTKPHNSFRNFFSNLLKRNGKIPQTVSGKVIASDAFMDCLEECQKIAKSYGIENEINFVQADATDTKLPESSVDVVVMRSVLVHILDTPKAINEFFRILKPEGRISCYEAIMSNNTKLCSLINPENFPEYRKFKEIEDKIMSDENYPLMNFNEDSLKKNLEEAGFKNIDIIPAEPFSKINFSKDAVDQWLNATLSVGQPSLKEKFLQYLSENELNIFVERLKNDLGDKIVTMDLPKVYIFAEKQ